MKNLNEYIKESLLDDEEDLAMDDDAINNQWIKDNYNIRGQYTLKDRVVNGVAVFVAKTNNLTSLTNGNFRFGAVLSFYCSGNRKLKTLEGAPQKVVNDFRCDWCTNLKTLEGGPEDVGGTFSCTHCLNITDLKGSPREAKHINCIDCKKLDSLAGLSKKVKSIEFKGTPVYDELNNK